MELNRPIVLSIAGFDPTAGAGVLADVKTMEQCKVYGMCINTGITLQSHDKFISCEWESDAVIKNNIELLFTNYKIEFVKIGLTKDLNQVWSIIQCLKKNNSEVKIILDPIIKTSSDFTIWKDYENSELLNKILNEIYLLTPNYIEAQKIWNTQKPEEILSSFTVCNVLLKGGHNENNVGLDLLFSNRVRTEINSFNSLDIFPKHGSGCVLSAAITAYLAHGNTLELSCRKAKFYIEHFLNSNKSLLGYHVA